jgi:hypothetical protein
VGDISKIKLKTADCVPKKFVVASKDNPATSVDVQATATNPYKFLSSDNTISVANTINAGEINFKSADNPQVKNFIYRESLASFATRAMLQYNNKEDFFKRPYPHFKVNLKYKRDKLPKTSDLFLVAYYPDYIESNPDVFGDAYGIFFFWGLAPEDPDIEQNKMLAIFSRYGAGTIIELHIEVCGEYNHFDTYRLHRDLPTTEFTGQRVVINLSEYWSKTERELLTGSFFGLGRTMDPADPAADMTVLEHIFLTYQYEE